MLRPPDDRSDPNSRGHFSGRRSERTRGFAARDRPASAGRPLDAFRLSVGRGTECSYIAGDLHASHPEAPVLVPASARPLPRRGDREPRIRRRPRRGRRPGRHLASAARPRAARDGAPAVLRDSEAPGSGPACCSLRPGRSLGEGGPGSLGGCSTGRRPRRRSPPNRTYFPERIPYTDPGASAPAVTLSPGRSPASRPPSASGKQPSPHHPPAPSDAPPPWPPPASASP